MTTESNANNGFSSEAQAALAKEAGLSLSGWQQEVSRGLEFGLEAAASIGDRSIPTFSRGELPHYAGINTLRLPPLWIPDGRDSLRARAEDRPHRMFNRLCPGGATRSRLGRCKAQPQEDSRSQTQDRHQAGGHNLSGFAIAQDEDDRSQHRRPQA